MLVAILIEDILPCLVAFIALKINKIATNGERIIRISNIERGKTLESAVSDIRTGAVS